MAVYPAMQGTKWRAMGWEGDTLVGFAIITLRPLNEKFFKSVQFKSPLIEGKVPSDEDYSSLIQMAERFARNEGYEIIWE